jgi:hypothetical protein
MGFLDWVSFGLGVVNVASNVSSAMKLEDLRRQGADSALIQSILVEIRNLVFDSREKIKSLEPHVADHPLPVYTLARSVDWRLRLLGISPKMFTEFRDKEYCQETLNQLDALLQNAKSGLSPQQVQDGEDCIQALAEMTLLEKAVASQTALEQAQALDKEGRQLYSEYSQAPQLIDSNKRQQGLKFLAIGISGCFFTNVLSSIPFIIAGVIPSGASETISAILGAGILIGSLCSTVLSLIFVVLIGIGVINLLTSSKKSAQLDPKYYELNRQREHLKTTIADSDTQKSIINTFGQRTSQEYRQLLEDRQAVVKSVLGGLEGGEKLVN